VVFRLDDDIHAFARTFNEHLQELTERGLQVRGLPKLHAKLYWSESEVINREDILKRAGIKASEGSRAPRNSKRMESTHAPEVRQGFCIRCSIPITLDQEKPYCWDDFQKWAEYENPDYEDSYCHSCGKEFPATMNKPLCRSCYRKMTG